MDVVYIAAVTDGPVYLARCALRQLEKRLAALAEHQWSAVTLLGAYQGSDDLHRKLRAAAHEHHLRAAWYGAPAGEVLTAAAAERAEPLNMTWRST